jgi:predicted acyl esterase
MIKLCDVSPFGKSINVLDLGIRARYRDLDYQHPKLIEPGKVYHYKIPLGPTSYYFKEKHRIRIDIISIILRLVGILSKKRFKYKKSWFLWANQKKFWTNNFYHRYAAKVNVINTAKKKTLIT